MFSLRGNRKKRIEISDPDMKEYFTYLYSPTRVFIMNFFVGIARGFGFVMGATVVVALILYLVSQILVEIPLVGNFFEWLNQFLQKNLENNRYPFPNQFGM